MQIKVNGYLPSEFKKSIRLKIVNKEVRTWELVEDAGYKRLLHTGDEQYFDVVIRLVGPSDKEKEQGSRYIEFIPAVRENVKGAEAVNTAKGHFGVVLGRLAELLNCHYTEVGEYKTEL